MHAIASKRMAQILLIEDNLGDVRLIREAFRESQIETNLYDFQSGEDALHYLYNISTDPGTPFPDLVLLDLNLPRKSGHEVLSEIKSAPELKHIPVLIFSTSQNSDEIMQLYKEHASCYIVKPTDFANYLDAVKSIEDFWLNTVYLPMEASK